MIAATPRPSACSVNDKGSIAPLAIGLAMISLVAILTTVAASSLFLYQKRLLTLAEATALFAVTTGEPAKTFLTIEATANIGPITVAQEQMVDGQTLEVRLCSEWASPFAVVGIPLAQIVCAEARSRLI